MVGNEPFGAVMVCSRVDIREDERTQLQDSSATVLFKAVDIFFHDLRVKGAMTQPTYCVKFHQDVVFGSTIEIRYCVVHGQRDETSWMPFAR